MSANTYSAQWFELFGNAVEPAQTAREVQFLTGALPIDSHRRILDVCCGSGRHAVALARAGYQVTGIDANEQAIAKARNRIPGTFVTFALSDLQSLERMPGAFDGVICMWQSFGQFDDALNLRVLQNMADLLRPRGRIVLDVYNREFFEHNQGTRQFNRGGTDVTETKRMQGDRLEVRLAYANGGEDMFQWRLYRFDEWRAMLDASGVELMIHCRDFDEHNPPDAAVPRMQLVAEKAP